MGQVFKELQALHRRPRGSQGEGQECFIFSRTHMSHPLSTNVKRERPVSVPAAGELEANVRCGGERRKGPLKVTVTGANHLAVGTGGERWPWGSSGPSGRSLLFLQ